MPQLRSKRSGKYSSFERAIKKYFKEPRILKGLMYYVLIPHVAQGGPNMYIWYPTIHEMADPMLGYRLRRRTNIKTAWINSSCLLWISCPTPAEAGQSQEWVKKVGYVVWNCSRVSVCLPNKHETLNWCCFNGIKTASAQIIVVAWCRLVASGVFILSLLSAGGTGPTFYLPLSLVSTSPKCKQQSLLTFQVSSDCCLPSHGRLLAGLDFCACCVLCGAACRWRCHKAGHTVVTRRSASQSVTNNQTVSHRQISEKRAYLHSLTRCHAS